MRLDPSTQPGSADLGESLPNRVGSLLLIEADQLADSPPQDLLDVIEAPRPDLKRSNHGDGGELEEDCPQAWSDPPGGARAGERINHDGRRRGRGSERGDKRVPGLDRSVAIRRSGGPAESLAEQRVFVEDQEVV